MPLRRHTLAMNSTLGQKETKDLIKKHTARIRAKKARILKKVNQASQPSIQPGTCEPQKDTLARAIDMAMSLEVHEEEFDSQQQETSNSTNSKDHDKAIDNVLEALDTPCSSSSSSENSSDSQSSSSSSSSDSVEWGTVKTYVQNPFAQQGAATDESTAIGTAQGPGQAKEGAIKRKPPMKKMSVTIRKLTNKVLEQFNCLNATQTARAAPTMSAKNITKDRSTSRGRNEKKDRFNKGRADGNGTEGKNDGQEQTGGGPGGNGHDQGRSGASGQEIPSGKRPRDPPKTGMHDDTMGEDTEDEEIPGAKRAMTSIREKLTQMYTKRTRAFI